MIRIVITPTVHVTAICHFRYESNSGGEREIQRTMLELLNQLDGFDSRGDVKVGFTVLVHLPMCTVRLFGGGMESWYFGTGSQTFLQLEDMANYNYKH